MNYVLQDHMTYVVKTDIFTGHEEIFISSEDYFSLYICRKTMHFLKLCTVSYESITYCQRKFC